MKSIVLLVLSIVFISSFSTCQKVELDVDVPSCIKKKIREIQQDNDDPGWRYVSRLVDENETFYYITSPCCDQFNYVYNSKCEQICALDGGIMGTGDGECPEFSADAEWEIIWKDE